MTSLSVVIVVVALVAAGNADQLLRVQLSGRSQADEFRAFADERNLDIWEISRSSANVRVPDSLLEEIKARYSTKVLIQDVFAFAEDSMKKNNLAKLAAKRMRTSDSINSYYHQFDEIVQWLDQLQSSNAYVQVKDVGLTYEKRMMKVIRIAADDSREGDKPAIFLTGGIHAREWLSPATINYMIDQIIKLRNSGDPRITKLLNKFDFYFMPVTNPDGYAYTFTSQYNRMWRKTRRPIKGNRCVGSDPNRNFDVEFGQRGTSTDSCSDSYPGPYPFSEYNVQNLRDFAFSLSGRLKLYYDVHSYSQFYFVPFAYNRRVKPENDAELRRVGLLANAAIEKVNGRKFELGTVGELLYDASGSTMDWFFLKAPAKYAYALELYPRNAVGGNGFIVPTSAIVPSGKEILQGLLTAAENIKV